MDFQEYQERTEDTAIYGEQIGKIVDGLKSDDPLQLDNIVRLLRLSYVSNGLGETGEVQGKIKKIIRDSGGVITDEHRKMLVGELGDVLWYVSQMASELGVELDDIAAHNIDKLSSRKERGVIGGSGDNR